MWPRQWDDRHGYQASTMASESLILFGSLVSIVCVLLLKPLKRILVKWGAFQQL